jgi:hypothetical protein
VTRDTFFHSRLAARRRPLAFGKNRIGRSPDLVYYS